MKKILLTTAAVAALSTSAFAEMSLDNKFYLRADVMGSKFSKISGAKSKFNIGMDIGAGYYFTDSIRAELVFNHAFAPTFKHPGSVNATIKPKANVDALMARAYYDVADLGMAKIFVGVGAGMARVQSKTNVALTTAGATGLRTATTTVAAGVGTAGYDVAVSQIADAREIGIVAPFAAGQSATIKSKKKNNFAYSLTLGSAFEVAEGVKFDVAYSFRDYGSLAEKGDILDTKKVKLRAHNVSAGVRFDI